MMAFFLLAIAGFWLLYTVIALRNVAAAPPLPASDQLDKSVELPIVSVVIAARNEGARIEQTLRSLLSQRGITLQLIVVDDRSTDATPDILRRLADEDRRLIVARVDQLPEGWLGKCHACWMGTQRATGEWLLFSDGDVHMSPDLLVRAVATAERDAADHVTLWPGLNSCGLVTRGSLLAWGQLMSLYAPPAQINADRGRRGVGVGAFNLVRAAAYRAVGGHEALRMQVVDDMKLGLLLRRAGFRQRVYAGFRDLEVEWADSPGGLIRVVEKNWFAAMDYSLWKGTLVIACFAVFWLAGIAGPLLDGYAGWAALAATLTPILPALIQARQMGWPWYTAVFAPFGFVLFVLAGIHSMWKTLRQGGIRWRDTFYPLSALRAAAECVAREGEAPAKP